ncbi:MAG: hypothetical protein MAG431_00589 [Chloroflexi bacterium]|nr:hypothetical protein [Chloroflexota bacterium]
MMATETAAPDPRPEAMGMEEVTVRAEGGSSGTLKASRTVITAFRMGLPGGKVVKGASRFISGAATCNPPDSRPTSPTTVALARTLATGTARAG